jgi:hypothetical protein
MFKGKYLDVYLVCKEGEKAVHIILNISASNYDPVKFFSWITDAGLKKKNYEEQPIDGSDDLLKVELIALLEAGREGEIKKKIDDFLGKLNLSKENIYVSEITDKLIIDSAPYLMTGRISKESGKLLPIYSKKHFIRSMNDLILAVGFDIMGKFSNGYYTNGYTYMGRQYLEKCQELGFDRTKIDEPQNKRIIQELSHSCYAAEITGIAKKEVDGKAMIKVQVKDNFFLYHPTCESRLDVHNALLSSVISLKVRNCAVLRDILTGFFEKIYLDAGLDAGYAHGLEDKKYSGFEYDFIDGNHCILDFESSNWNPVSTSNKIPYRKLHSLAEEHPDMRHNCCKAVSLMKRYRVFIDKKTRNPVPWNNLDENDPNILSLDYVSFTQDRVGDHSLKEAFSFKKRVDEDFYIWRSEINKIFYTYFFAEGTPNPLNTHLVKREPDPDPKDDVCTFFFYDREFIDYS